MLDPVLTPEHPERMRNVEPVPQAAVLDPVFAPERPERVRKVEPTRPRSRGGFLLVGMLVMVGGVGAALANPAFSLGPLSPAERPVLASERSMSPSTTASPPVAPPTTIDPIPAPATSIAPATPIAQENWAPTAVRVPKIGVDAPIDPMGVDAEQALEVPEDTARVGWWSGGAEPGEGDPSVLVGHVDSYTGPAVFYRLEELVAGDTIEVDRADGTTAHFMIDRLESYPKSEFPTDAVYGGTDWPTLRLITCYGSFDEAERSYQDNLVAYAHLVG